MHGRVRVRFIVSMSPPDDLDFLSQAELKGLVPDDAQQAIGHGIGAKRSKAGAITFELLKPEDSNAAVE